MRNPARTAFHLASRGVRRQETGEPGAGILRTGMIGIFFCLLLIAGTAGCMTRLPGGRTGSTQLPPQGPTTPVRAPVEGGPNVTIELVAQDMAFSTKEITVPPGTAVVVQFHNREAPGSSQVTGMAHNFAVYDSPAAGTMIFRGEIITGGSDAVYRFTAPEKQGTYYFQCDVHPAVMNGRFTVQ